jgi:hypothetical protein
LWGLFWRDAITHPTRRFIADDAQAVTPFAAKSMHQTTRFFVRQLTRFASAIAQHRPDFSLQITWH